MTFELERQAIEQRFSANWNATAADRIEYENVPFKRPASGSYVRLSIRNGEARQASISSKPLNRYNGVIIVDCFVEINTGTDTVRGLAESAAVIFRNVQFSVTGSGLITTRVPRIVPVGNDAGWFLMSMSVPYSRDKVD